MCIRDRLYPNDSSENGKELRLRQQYFLASASIKDAVRLWERQGNSDYSLFAADNVFQMNDTHPTVAVAELMRILVDKKGMGWDEAWAITTQCMAYTNHTLLPEALERWPLHLFEKLLPRILEIIYEINARFLREVSMKWPVSYTHLDVYKRQLLAAPRCTRRIRSNNRAIITASRPIRPSRPIP